MWARVGENSLLSQFAPRLVSSPAMHSLQRAEAGLSCPPFSRVFLTLWKWFRTKLVRRVLFLCLLGQSNMEANFFQVKFLLNKSLQSIPKDRLMLCSIGVWVSGILMKPLRRSGQQTVLC